MPAFECQATREDDHARLSLYGEFDIAAVAHFEAALEELERDRPDRILVDLRGVTFLDSTGLRALLVADTRAREAGRRLILLQGPDAVRRVFEITGLEERLELVDDEASLAS
jgi:anti-anti-sigma factor